MSDINSFEELYKVEKEKEYFIDIIHKVNNMYASKDIEVFPARENIFASMKNTPLDTVKVVIIGQDPYHGVGEAHGLSFSVLPGIKTPPSLQNIYKELRDDVGTYIPNNRISNEMGKTRRTSFKYSLNCRKGQTCKPQ